MDLIIEYLEEFNKKLSIDHIIEFNYLLEDIKKCKENFSAIKENSDEIILTISNVYMHLGYIKAVLNSKLPLMDPLSEKTLKKQHCEKMKIMFDNIGESYLNQNKVYSNTSLTLHPYYHEVQYKITELNNKIRKLNKYVAVRPTNILYKTVIKVSCFGKLLLFIIFDILQAVNHGFTTILSPQTITGSIHQLNKLILDVQIALNSKEAIDNNFYNGKVSQYEFSISNYENLIQEWAKYRDGYPDVIEPLLYNIAEFLYGLKMKLSLLKKKLIQHEYILIGFDIGKDIQNLLKYPVLDDAQTQYDEYLGTLTHKKTINFLETVFQNAENPYLAKSMIFRYS